MFWPELLLSEYFEKKKKKINRLDLQGHNFGSGAATDVSDSTVIGESQHGLGASSVPLTVNFKLM